MVSYDPATRTAFFKPSVNLDTMTAYHATIGKAATSSNGVQMAADYTWSFTTGFGTLLNLTLTVAGSGSGAVTSSAPDFNCLSGTCYGQFSYANNLNLTATPGIDTIFKNWTGDCDSILDNTCHVYMDGDKHITATFSSTKPVRILGGGYYDTLQEAFNAVTSPDCIVQTRAVVLTGNLNVNTDSDLTLAGGFDSDFTGKSGDTTLVGTMTIARGALTVEDLVIR